MVCLWSGGRTVEGTERKKLRYPDGRDPASPHPDLGVEAWDGSCLERAGASFHAQCGWSMCDQLRMMEHVA